MAEKSPENNNIKKPEGSKKLEAVGMLAGISGIIKKVRKSIASTLKGSGIFLKRGIKKISRFLNNRFAYAHIPAVAAAAKEMLKPDKPKEGAKEKNKGEIISEEAKPASENTAEPAAPKLLNIPSGLSFVDKQANDVTPNKKIGSIVCKGGSRHELSDADAPACTVNIDGTITVKPEDGEEKKYNLDTLLHNGDSYTAYLSTKKPENVRVIKKKEIDLFQEEAA